jgi:hypothetical protein
MNDELNEMYVTVAVAFAKQLDILFTSDSTLQAAWEEMFPHTPCDHTGKWDLILGTQLRAIWKEHFPVGSNPTAFDVEEILRQLPMHVDYNIWTQVYLNFQRWGQIRYAVEEAEKDSAALTIKWAGKSPNPFDAKAKMFKAANAEEGEFNRALSQLKALKIIAAFAPGHISFRVSPKRSTPALVDSANISMLGIGGDCYLRVPGGLNIFYFCWDTAPEMMTPIDGKPNCFQAVNIDYEFESKSGGDTLNQVLYARYLMFVVACGLKETISSCLLLPRMTSLLVVTSRSEQQMKNIATTLRGNPQLVVGSR